MKDKKPFVKVAEITAEVDIKKLRDLWKHYYGEEDEIKLGEYIVSANETYDIVGERMLEFTAFIGKWANEFSELKKEKPNDPRLKDKDYLQIGYMLYRTISFLHGVLEESIECPHFKSLIEKYHNGVTDDVDFDIYVRTEQGEA